MPLSENLPEENGWIAHAARENDPKNPHLPPLKLVPII
jgi:hypothetical protein